MSKKAAKKATKPQPAPKSKGASKDAVKKHGKDGASSKPEVADDASAVVVKGAKRRVTVSVSTVEPDTKPLASAGETRATAAANGETSTGKGRTSKAEENAPSKRTRRIISVPSEVASSEGATVSGQDAGSFANSPFAADVADTLEPVVESERSGETGAKGPKRVSEGKTKKSRGAAKAEPAATDGKQPSRGADLGKKVAAKVAKSAAPKNGKAGVEQGASEPEASSGDVGTRAEKEQARKSAKQAKPTKGGKGDETIPDAAAVEGPSKKGKPKPSKSRQAVRSEAQAELDIAEPLVESPNVPAAAKSRSKRGGATDVVGTDDVGSPIEHEDHADRAEQLPLAVIEEPLGDDDEDDDDDAVLQISAELGDDEDAEELTEEEENRRYLKGIIEALLFASDKALTGRELARAARIDKKRTLQLLVELRKEYKHRGVNIVEVSGGYVLRSNPLYGAFVQKALALRPVKLSRAQLETLAIIAYRQPITRPEIDDIRGVDSGQVLKGLADRDLIKMLGKKDEAGRPMLYGTTQTFLELFSLDSLKGLPNLREFTELSDDSREKFAAVTGETIPGPTVMSEEGAEETTGRGDDATNEGEAPRPDEDAERPTSEASVGEGSAPPNGEVESSESEATPDDVAPLSSKRSDSDEEASEDADEEASEDADGGVQEAVYDAEDEDADASASSDGDDSGAAASDLGASDPEWDDPPEPDFPDEDSR